MKRFLFAVGTGILILPLVLYGKMYSLRPQRTQEKLELFQGIIYNRQIWSKPRPAMIHIVTIDLTAPGIKAFVTPGMSNFDDFETNARTTSEFLKEFKLQLAINASYFYPFAENTPWDYSPRRGDRTGIVGEAISNGHRYSQPQSKWSVFCILNNNRAQILDSHKCPQGTYAGIAGDKILVDRAQAVNLKLDNDKPYPRTAVGVDREGKKLWLVIVDGKQPRYSEGVTIIELTKIFVNLGVNTALNLDGGGSATLAIAKNRDYKLLNAPSHTKIPMRERPVANHLGFYALPKKVSSEQY